MRVYFWAAVLIATVLTGCGNSTPSESDANANNSSSELPGSTGVADIRSIMPPDLDADGIPDAIPHSTMRRLLMQAPAGTGFQISRNARNLPFAVTTLTLSDGSVVHELELETPLGEQPLILRAGDYSLSIIPSADTAQPLPWIVHPTTPGALSNDLAQPEGVLFLSPSQVGLGFSGGLPSLAAGPLTLTSGKTREVPLQLSLAADGLRAEPSSSLEPRTVYRLQAANEATGPYGEPAYSSFHLLCRSGPEDQPIRTLTADLNRDGDDEVISLFADGAVTALVDPAGKAEGILPSGDETALDFAAGDFDGNGATDLALMLHSDEGGRLLYLYNQTRIGDARFAMQSDLLPMEAPLHLQAADFDRDGRSEVAVLGAFGEVFIPYSGRQAQLFQALSERALSASFSVADANADGKPDIYVLAADGSGQLSLNVGAGFGSDLGLLPLGSDGAMRVTTGELDGDKHSDFIFTGNSDTLEVVLGAQMENHPFGVQGIEDKRFAGAVLCKDCNRDSRMDIFVALEDANGVCDEVAIYLNSDKSNGGPDTVLPLGARVSVYALEYWKDHIVFATSAGLLILKVNPADMPPTVESKVRFVESYTPVPQIPAPLAAAIADFNDDGKADMAALDRDGNLQIWLSGAEGEPFTLSGDPIALGADGVLQAIDFDRDNSPDLLYIPNDPDVNPRVLRNTREGRFEDNEDGLLPTPPSNLRGAPALGDFDRDGNLDVLWPSPLGRVQINDGERRWIDGDVPEVREGVMRLQFSGELTCADFTNDGIEDVVAVMRDSEDGTGLEYLVLFEGTGRAYEPFDVVVSSEIKGRLFGLSPADFDGDGHLDLAVGLGTNGEPAKLTLLRLGAGRRFQTFDGAPESKGKLLDLALDDLDRDGDLDLIASEELTEGGSLVTLWVNDGHGGFGEATEAQRSLVRAIGEFHATNLSLADFTGDGRADLMAIDREGNVVIVRTTLP